MNNSDTTEFEHKAWGIFFTQTLSTLPQLLQENPAWKEPLKKILSNVTLSGISHNNYIDRRDLSGEPKLFIVTTLMLLDDPEKPSYLDLWKRFWVKYGYALFEYSKLNSLTWRIAWSKLSGYELFQAPFDKITFEVFNI